jgi:hypothetical protein
MAIKRATLALSILSLSGCHAFDGLSSTREPEWDYVVASAPSFSGPEWAKQAFPGPTSADRDAQLTAKFAGDVAYCRDHLDIHEPFLDANKRDRLSSEDENLNVDPATEPAGHFTQLRDCATELAYGRSLTALRIQFRKDLRMCIAQYAPAKLEDFDRNGSYAFGDIPSKALQDQPEPVARCLIQRRYTYRYDYRSFAH